MACVSTKQRIPQHRQQRKSSKILFLMINTLSGGEEKALKSLTSPSSRNTEHSQQFRCYRKHLLSHFCARDQPRTRTALGMQVNLSLSTPSSQLGFLAKQKIIPRLPLRRDEFKSQTVGELLFLCFFS